jgi:hypothetical protein
MKTRCQKSKHYYGRKCKKSLKGKVNQNNFNDEINNNEDGDSINRQFKFKIKKLKRKILKKTDLNEC